MYPLNLQDPLASDIRNLSVNCQVLTCVSEIFNLRCLVKGTNCRPKRVLVPFGLHFSRMNSIQRAIKSLYTAFSLYLSNPFTLQHTLMQSALKVSVQDSAVQDGCTHVIYIRQWQVGYTASRNYALVPGRSIQVLLNELYKDLNSFLATFQEKKMES